MHLLPCRYHDDACFSFVFSTDVAVFGARTLSRSRDLKRRDGLHHNTDVRSMFYVFDTLAVLVLTSIALVADIRCTPEVGERHLLQRPMFSTCLVCYHLRSLCVQDPAHSATAQHASTVGVGKERGRPMAAMGDNAFRHDDGEVMSRLVCQIARD